MSGRVVHVKREAYDVYVGRAMPRQGLKGSVFANPFKIGKDGSREEVIGKYREYAQANPLIMRRVHELRGKTLACWCAPEPCHADVLLELANETSGGVYREQGG